MKLTNKKISESIGNLISKVHALEDCESQAGKINTEITAAAKALVGHSFIYRADGEIIVVQATDMPHARQFKGRCVYATYAAFGIDSPTSYDIYTDDNFFLSPARIDNMTIIANDEFERIYKAAQNIIGDRQLQINELVKVIEACVNESVKHENE